ncbi:MAG: hypothetical protein ABJH05_11815 [Fulvivirga sp.]
MNNLLTKGTSVLKHSIVKYPILIITVAYLIVSTFLFVSYGIKVVNDTHRYMEYAENLNQGIYIDQHNIWYVGYVLFLFVIQKISSSHEAIILAQYALAYVAVLCLYRTAFMLSNCKLTAVVAALIYCCFMEILTWCSYLIPEGIYISCLTITFFLLVKSTRLASYIFPTSLFIIFTCLIKPTGIALIGAILIGVTYKVGLLIKSRNVKILVSTSVCLLLLLLANRMLNTFILIENYVIGEIVYAITSLPNHPDIELLTLDIPKDIYVPSKDISPLPRLALFIINNPVFFLKLSLSKVAWFILHIRPYWSTGHNIFVMLFLMPLYYFSAVFIISEKRSSLKIFTFTFIIIHIITIAFTTVDWDGRFFMPLMPILIIFGSMGLMNSKENRFSTGNQSLNEKN